MSEPIPCRNIQVDSSQECMYLCVCRCCFYCAPTRQTHTDPCQQEMASAKPSVSACGSPLGNPRHTHTCTDKHPSRSSNGPTRRIAPCPAVHPLPGRVRFMSCPGFHFKETARCPIRSPSSPSTTGSFCARSRPQDGAQIPPPFPLVLPGRGQARVSGLSPCDGLHTAENSGLLG